MDNDVALSMNQYAELMYKDLSFLKEVDFGEFTKIFGGIDCEFVLKFLNKQATYRNLAESIRQELIKCDRKTIAM